MAVPYVGTYAGEIVNLVDIQPSSINIKSIVHSLHNQCRFNGHTKSFFSVAQHTLLVHQILLAHTNSSEIILFGLLHDASEAYLSDIPAPLKAILPDYQSVERHVQEAIEKKFIGRVKTQAEQRLVDIADNISFQIEATQLMDTSKWSGYTFSYELISNWLGVYHGIANMKKDGIKRLLHSYIDEYSK